MTNFQNIPTVPGFERHHLVPQQFATHAVIQRLQAASAEFLAPGRGFTLDDPSRNAIILPTTVAGSQATGLALHNGSHPSYSDVVRRQLDNIQGSAAFARMSNEWLSRSERMSAFLDVTVQYRRLEDQLRVSLLDTTEGRHGRFAMSTADPRFQEWQNTYNLSNPNNNLGPNELLTEFNERAERGAFTRGQAFAGENLDTSGNPWRRCVDGDSLRGLGDGGCGGCHQTNPVSGTYRTGCVNSPPKATRWRSSAQL